VKRVFFFFIIFFLLNAAFPAAILACNLTCTFYIICHHATHILEIFHIFQFFMIYHTLYWRFVLLSFPHIHFHYILPSNFNESINSTLYYRFFLNQQRKVICMCHSACYFFFFLDVPSIFKF